MRRSKTFKIDGYEQQIEIKEMTVREIIELAQTGDGKLFAKDNGEGETKGGTLADLRDFIATDFLPKCTNLKIEDLLDLTPSAIEEIFDKFKEVNSAFFAMAGKTGLAEFGKNIKQAIINDFSAMLVGSLRQATETQSSTTDIPSS